MRWRKITTGLQLEICLFELTHKQRLQTACVLPHQTSVLSGNKAIGYPWSKDGLWKQAGCQIRPNERRQVASEQDFARRISLWVTETLTFNSSAVRHNHVAPFLQRIAAAGKRIRPSSSGVPVLNVQRAETNPTGCFVSDSGNVNLSWQTLAVAQETGAFHLFPPVNVEGFSLPLHIC